LRAERSNPLKSVVKVKANQARPQKILEGVDWNALEKLIQTDHLKLPRPL